MKFLFSVLTIALLCFVSEYFMPWWAIAVVSLLVSLFAGHKPGRGFLMGFCGVGLCWLGIAAVKNTANEHILASRMAELFHLPGQMFFLAVTVLLGALIGGLFAWSGSLIRKNS